MQAGPRCGPPDGKGPKENAARERRSGHGRGKSAAETVFRGSQGRDRHRPDCRRRAQTSFRPPTRAEPGRWVQTDQAAFRVPGRDEGILNQTAAVPRRGSGPRDQLIRDVETDCRLHSKTSSRSRQRSGVPLASNRRVYSALVSEEASDPRQKPRPAFHRRSAWRHLPAESSVAPPRGRPDSAAPSADRTLP